MAIQFALIDDKDTTTSLAFFNSKNVKRENIFHISQLNQLGARINVGDTVWCADVDRFGSVIVFYNFIQLASTRGINFRALANSYLNFGGGKTLKPSVVKFVRYLASMENKLVNDILSMGKNGNRSIVSAYCGALFIDVLGQTFASDSILKRGS
ncbi:MAG: hypothetical protein J6B90_08705 [Lachnospiraceae bacterium]|nr:hypothetical protein [Lachnospiraceae bacterium]